MRHDMDKVIVERPRPGSRNKSLRKGYRRSWQRMAAEDYPRRERMKALRGGERPFNEHLAPLRRFLDKNVGRPWNKVFAEICAHIRQDSAVQSHVRDHVFDFVEVHVVLVDGRPCHGRPPRYGQPLDCGYGWLRFYVCPKSGLLKRVRRSSRRRSRPRPDYVVLDALRQLRRIDGHWYEIALRPLAVAAAEAWDILLRQPARELAPWRAHGLYGSASYAASKRQLGKRELRRLPIVVPAGA